MARRLLLIGTLLASFALVLSTPAVAGSADYLKVYNAYRNKGEIDGCKFTAKQLAAAKSNVPPDIDTYAPDFVEALDAALSRRASGACDTKAAAKKAATATPRPARSSTSSTATTGAPTAASPAPVTSTPAGVTGATGAAISATVTPAPAADVTAAPAAADGSVALAPTSGATHTGDAPLPLALLAAIAVLALLGAFAWALIRFFAFDPAWLAAGRHATAEAGWRASASWAEFLDWLRLGR